jgi:GTPase SAR1 family protein
MNQYELFNERRAQLLNILSKSSEICELLGQHAQKLHLSQIYNKVSSDQFKVMVLGTFKNGKSTFINALLGEAVLPAFAVPCTAVINEVKWAKEKSAVLHFRNPLPKPLPVNLSKRAVSHIEAANGEATPPMRIPIEELETYVAIDDPARPQDESIAESPYDKAEIFWPIELCRNGVEIIDSPGLNEHGIREKVTVEYVAQADAILFVMSSLALASQTETNFVELNLHNSGHKEIFFICNRFDQLDSAQEQERIKAFALQKLMPLTDLKKGVFFLSAKQAINGRRDVNEELLERSGILELEKSLSEFLVNERGRLKLLTPARELNLAAGQLISNVIPGQRRLLTMANEDVDRKVKEITPKLVDARRAKDQILREMSQHFELLHRDVRDEAVKFLNDIACQIPTIIEGTPTEVEIKTFTLKQKQQVEQLVKELMEKLDIEVQRKVKAWQDSVLDPMLKASVNTLQQGMKVSVEMFYERLDFIKGELFSDRASEVTIVKDPSSSERFFATALGLVFGDIGSAAYGARFGFHGLGTAIAVQIGVIVVLAITVGLNPLILFPAIIATSLFNAQWAAGSIKQKIKKKVGEELQSKFKESIDGKVSQIIGKLAEVTANMRGQANAVLERDIVSIQEQVDAALKDKQAGEEIVQAKIKQLESVEKELFNVIDQLKEFLPVPSSDSSLTYQEVSNV